MNDKAKPLRDGLTPSGYDEYGDDAEQASTPEKVHETEREREASRNDTAPGAEPNAGESPLG